MNTALITGISGQDGCYLAELLIDKGYHVVGTSRNSDDCGNSIPQSLKNNIEITDWDLIDQDRIIDVVSKFKPKEIYNLASYTSGSGMYDDPVGIGEINGLAVSRILEAIRLIDSNIHFCQASSREIFGTTSVSPQSEKTPPNPRSPYGSAKLYADSMVKIYRKHYNLHACSAILFNHESPRRRLEFVTRKISHEAARIKLGLSKELHLGNLDTMRDWGFAGDYVYAMWLMLQQSKAEDYIIATGEAHSVRDFCEYAFSHLDLNYNDYVYEDSSSFRPSEPALLIGDISAAQKDLNWKPRISFQGLVSMMVDADLQILKSDTSK